MLGLKIMRLSKMGISSFFLFLALLIVIPTLSLEKIARAEEPETGIPGARPQHNRGTPGDG